MKIKIKETVEVVWEIQFKEVSIYSKLVKANRIEKIKEYNKKERIDYIPEIINKMQKNGIIVYPFYSKKWKKKTLKK